MKKLLVLMLFAGILSSPVMAQENKDKDKQKDHSEWQQKIKDELKLSADQVSKWDALNKEYKEKMDAAAQTPGLDKDAQKAKKMELKKEKEAKFMELLSAEQQAKYKEMIEKKKKEAEASKPAGN
jgi:hypothetical protein